MVNAEGQFIEDTVELLSSLEQNLLGLDEHQFDQELYDAIFRELHTLKGSLYMFGRKELGDLTHQMESAYADFKEASIPLPHEIIQLCFSMVDFIQSTMHLTSLTSEEHKEVHASITKSIEEFCDEALRNVTNRRKKTENTSIHLVTLKALTAIKEEDGHPVHFIIRDLLEDIDAQQHISLKKNKTINQWNLLFAADMEEDEVRALFLFVEDEIGLSIERYPIVGVDLQAVDLKVFSKELKQPKSSFKKKLADHADELVKKANEARKAKEAKEKMEIQPSQPSAPTAYSSDYIKVERTKIDSLMNWVSELVTLQATLQNEAETHKSEALRHIADSMDFITENLRDTIFSVSLVPLKSLESRFTRLVRDLSLSLKKKVTFESTGFETELDKKVISNLADPLLHILRNCIDHGIELPAKRKKLGKAETGSIHLNSYYSGNLVFIEIADDGGGIDPEKIKAKALEKGLLKEDQELSLEELIQLIFHPGFSTASSVSDVSGRGVGMDVVKKKIEELRGEVSIHSEVGIGTKITIKLPLSLSIMEGLLTKVGETNLVIPLNTIREIHRLDREAFHQRPQGSDILEVNGKQMSVVSIEEKLSVESSMQSTVDLITVDVGNNQKGVAVDEIKGQIKAVLKPIGEYYDRQDFISGGTILGDGKLAFVLDMEKIIN